MFGVFEEIIDNIIHMYNFRRYKRIYIGVACGFLVPIFIFPIFFDHMTPAAILICMAIFSIFGILWHINKS